METWQTALLIFGAVTIGMLGQGWVSFLEHQRRKQVLDLIKTMIQAGKEPPATLFAELKERNAQKAPWAEAVAFGVMAFGFWLAFFYIESERRTAFLVIAVTMTLTAIACLVFAFARSRAAGKATDDDPR